MTAIDRTLVTKRVVGWMDVWDADSLVLQRDPDRTRAAFPTPSVRRVEASTGRRGDPVAGGIVGFFAGIAAGVYLGAVAAGDDASDRGIVVACTALVGVTALGVVLGNKHKTEQWKAVYEK